LSTNPKEFVMLTRMLSKAGHELKSAGIRVVSTRGDYVSPHVRRIAHDFWGAELIDTYGSAELCGGASQCEHGSYHFDLTEIPEIFFGKENQVHDPANVGEIVITPLHPFQQALPLLRYMTGDLAKFTESCSCGRREVAISQFWGRRDSCLTITVGGHRSVLLSAFTLSDRLQDTNACSTTSRGVEECYPRFAWRMKRNGEKQTIIVVVKIRRGIGSHNSLVTRAVGEAIQGMLSPYSMDSTKVKIQVHQVTTDLPKSVDV